MNLRTSPTLRRALESGPRRWGILLLATAGLASALAFALVPFPGSVNDLPAQIGDHIEGKSRIVAWGGNAYSYDSTNDRTLVGVRFCSHSLCSPALWVQGDWREGLLGPVILAASSPGRVVPAPQPDTNSSFSHGRPIDAALEGTFRVEPVAPTAFAYGGSVIAALVGLALIAPIPTPRVWIAPAGAVVGAALGAREGTSDPLVIGLSLLLLAPLALGGIVVLAVTASRGKTSAIAAAIAAFAIAFLALGFLTIQFYTRDGFGD